MSQFINPRGRVRATLTNAGSSNLGVDGSATAQEFIWTSAQTSYIDSFSLLLEANNFVLTASSFMDLTNLSVGLLIEFQEKGTLFELDNLKLSRELIRFGTPSGVELFISTNAVIVSTHQFATPIVIESGEFFKVTVRDDLTGLVYGEAFLEGFEI